MAYGGILHERRRALHARIVEAMEQRYAERLTEQVEQLAHHALRGEVWEKVLLYCRQAGTKALARSANREAVAYFEQALGALTHLPDSRESASRPSICALTSALRSFHLEKWGNSLHTCEKPNCSLRPWAINVG